MDEQMEFSIATGLPTISFPDYEKVKEEAVKLAEHISQIEVTEENVKDAKRLLARVNASVDGLNRRRIDIKKEILKPYDEFAEKVKEIEEIVKSADKIVRDQVRDLEEQEREEKSRKLEEIWDKRIKQYEYAQIFKFTDWLESKHLNKTQSIAKSETEMVDWLETKEVHIATLAEMADADDLLAEYQETQDLGESLKRVNERKKVKAEQKEILQDVKEQEFIFVIKGEKDKRMVEMLFGINKINYELRS